jgi:hypothetical protein
METLYAFLGRSFPGAITPLILGPPGGCGPPTQE